MDLKKLFIFNWLVGKAQWNWSNRSV